MSDEKKEAKIFNPTLRGPKARYFSRIRGRRRRIRL
jgi:hypothetical protein